MGLFNRKRVNPARVAELESALVPRDQLLLEVVDADTEQGIAAAFRGDCSQLAETLKLTRTQRDWDRRSRLMQVLQHRSISDSGWLDRWLTESPDNADATCLKAWVLIGQAWEVRSHDRAKNVRRAQFEEFFRLLEAAAPTIQRARRLDPDDPEPLAVALCQARGVQAPREVFDQYRHAFAKIDPFHFECHAQALQFVCDKWYGSRNEMYDYAISVAESAPPDAQVQTLPVVAMIEQVAEGAAKELFDQFVDPLLDRAKSWVVSAQPRGGYLTAPANNSLAFLQEVIGLPSGAYDSLMAMGPYVTEFPWCYYGDALETTLETRADVIKLLATSS